MKQAYRRASCRLCEQKDLHLVVAMPSTPIGGDFVSEDKLEEEQELYPLDLHQCADCGHVQLLDVVDPKVLFSHYTYFSGSTGLINHFAEYADNVIKNNNLSTGSFIVDIGSNDGAFLQFFKQKGMKVLGIDPAENVAQFANDSGIKTVPAMFEFNLSQKIKEDYGPADVITANNVFAHTDDMIGMAKSVKNLLAENGVFSFEVSYLLDVVDKMLLGTIFHEHLCYHTVKPLASFLQRQGMELIDVKRVPIQGGSLICTAQLAGGKRKKSSSVDELIKLEEEKGVYQIKYLEEFSQKLSSAKTKVNNLISDFKKQGKTIAAFGAARGGTLLTYYFGLGKYLDYIVDDDPRKQTTYSPGYHIPVVPTSALYERSPDYVFILAWVHSKSIIKNNRGYLEHGGKFITFFPEVKIIGHINKEIST
ncbi:MAG: class I SAM-dependent methyltransferase [Nanoarchaeota archaeon]|nr:class I SAM-dependent methyltransferase [Nanoarchaeota archaeon]